MPVEPIPCAPDGGSGNPGDLTACCAPSIASSALCRADGTTVLLVVRSGCADCDTEAADPELAGWIDTSTGAFTPGPAPADAQPCTGTGDGPGTDDGCGDATVLRLCDSTPDGCVSFLRHLVHDCDGQVTAAADTELDGTTPYAPSGEVADCADCVPPAQPCAPIRTCPGLVGLSGPEEWTVPPGTESVQLTVACGPVTVYPCTGATDGVRINECGVSLNWSAPGTDCDSGALCEGFRIEVPEGAAVYVSWLSAGCGDES
ncbi:hypothetical protein AB0D24_04620 [Streptomyces javensis]|uniref:hypothetical protein n=1 Tax=Streptomyces javensis TaxID=114698 RepID=UPI0033EB797F